MKNQKIYIIIIVILVIIILGFAYNQWGRGLFKKNSGGEDAKIFKDDIQLGNNNAAVTIIEYFSYLCGYCKSFENEVKPQLLENYIQTGKARLILRIFPPYELGQAALCANEQGKFLEYHNELFENNDKITKINDLKTFAKNVGLKEDEFNQCYDSGKYQAKAEDWYEQGMSDMEKANIPSDQRGTPAFFINGEVVIGLMPYEDFAKKIEEKLKSLTF